MILAHPSDAIQKLKQLRNIVEFCSFLGLCKVFRRLVSSFARIASPFSYKPQNHQLKKFGPLYSKTFPAMWTSQKNFILRSILQFLYAQGNFSSNTDACNVQVGCVLLQDKPDSTKQLVGHWPRSLTKMEEAYRIT